MSLTQPLVAIVVAVVRVVVEVVGVVVEVDAPGWFSSVLVMGRGAVLHASAAAAPAAVVVVAGVVDCSGNKTVTIKEPGQERPTLV